MKKTGAKKALCILLAAFLLGLSLPFTALPVFAEDANFSYSVLSEDEKTAEIVSYTGTAEQVVIPSEIDGYQIVRIGAYVFMGNSTMESVSLPETVEEIGEGAFGVCEMLTDITLPSAVTVIEPLAFAGCTSMTAISVSSRNPAFTARDGVLLNKDGTRLIAYPAGKTDTAYSVPKNVAEIAEYAFFSCFNLQEVTVPQSVKTIGISAFQGCAALQKISLRYGLETIGEYAFNECSELTEISIPFGVTALENSTFEGCSALETVSLPNSLSTIGEYAFASCRALKQIVLPNSVSAIGKSAFSGCTALTSVNIPDRVTAIEAYTFSTAEALKEITVPSSVTAIDEFAFSYSGLTTVFGYSGSAAETFAAKNGISFVSLLPPTGIPGDLNQDGTSDLTDYALLSSIAIGAQFPTALETEIADLNADTAVDFFDVSLLNLVLNGDYHLPGDLDGNGICDATDAATLSAYLSGDADLTDRQKSAADINCDGAVTDADAVLLAKRAEMYQKYQDSLSA